MVSSSTVRDDLSQVTSVLNDYSSRIGELSSSWKGDSYNNLESKAQEFVSEFNSTLNSQMSDFALACDEYLSYEQKKRALEAAEANYQIALDDDDGIAKAYYSNRIASLSDDVRTIKAQIKSLLASAASYTLEASAKAYSAGKTDVAVIGTLDITTAVLQQAGNIIADNMPTNDSSTASQSQAHTDSASSKSSGSTVTSTMQKVADVASAHSGGGYDGYCEMWAETQWENATGIPRQRATSAYTAWKTFGVSTSKDNIPVGAMVYGSGSGSGNGHVGIYVGDGKVADQGGVTTLDSWLSWQKPDAHGNNGWIGWGWQNGIDLTA